MSDVLYVGLCLSIIVAVWASAVLLLQLRRCEQRIDRYYDR